MDDHDVWTESHRKSQRRAVVDKNTSLLYNICIKTKNLRNKTEASLCFSRSVILFGVNIKGYNSVENDDKFHFNLISLLNSWFLFFFIFFPTVSNAFQFASIIHWISLIILSLFFSEVRYLLRG